MASGIFRRPTKSHASLLSGLLCPKGHGSVLRSNGADVSSNLASCTLRALRAPCSRRSNLSVGRHTPQSFFKGPKLHPTNAIPIEQQRWYQLDSSKFPEASQHSAKAPSGISQPQYEPPQTGLLSYLPTPWVPYAELVRLDKPTGTYYLLFPCLFSTLMAANYSAANPSMVLTTSMLFSVGALVMRGAGCTINDLWDRNLDPHVNRTRLRPIARGAVAPGSAVIFTGLQLLTGLGVLLQFPSTCLYYGVPSLLLVAIYPLAKRVTHYPQVVLGLTFSWGAFMGFPALGIDALTNFDAFRAVGLLYASCVCWTVLYDMIYAHMDIKDDAKVGIKSIALRHEKQTKAVLSGLAVIQTGLLAAAGLTIGAGPLFFACSCGSTAANLGLMIRKVDLKDVSSCWWWFKNGAWFTGGGITMGLLADYLFTLSRSPELGPGGTTEEKNASI